MGKAKRYNAYDSDVAASRERVEQAGRDRQVFSTGSSFRSAPFQPNIATTSTSTGAGGTFGIGDPIILHEEDLGNCSGSMTVDWSLANKFRAILTGDCTASFINTPPDEGFVQQMVLEVRQDGTGGHSLTFADSFENDHVPVVAKGANIYSVWAFFASNRGTEPIFSFNTYQSQALLIALSDELSDLQTSSTIPAVTFRMPYPMTITSVTASLTTASSAGSTIINIKESGTTIFSTNLTIDSMEESSTTAATPVVISDPDLASDAEIEMFINTAGASTSGLKVALIGYLT